ncbi:MAG: hypothetical protein HYZ42_18080 [Bacteroidetes bacterium]|nr:hypothetical protein [Bacteroidota bacterium]
MEQIIQFFILLPLFGFFVSLLIPEKKENIISAIAFSTTGLHFVSLCIYFMVWLFSGHQLIYHKSLVLLNSHEYEFYIEFCFDKITATYLLVGSFLTFLVTVYSRYYMHRETGYKRFFNTILFFFVGYNLTVISGNFETLFIGWEILGISSFLLIAFYRERYLPVKNAVKVFSIYRIGDVGLILAMWASHHLWHENITFFKLSNAHLVSEHLLNHSSIGVFISLMILITAAAKSAQLPFSSWLPRAMEGPTPSSAIFYGSLSVHLGVFLLLRTFPFWENQLSIRILIAVLGLVTSVIATGIARVQSSIKSQIAYASIAQIGLIFIEVAAGFTNFALFHFAGNAFLRTYQLLVSPSVVSYLIREQFYNFSPKQFSIEKNFPKKIQYTLYMLCVKEWNLDSFMFRVFWSPFKKLGKLFDFLTVRQLLLFFIPTYILGFFCYYHREYIPGHIEQYFPIAFSLIGLVMVLKAFTERKKAILSWVLILMNHFWVALAISFNEKYKIDESILYLSGIIVAGFVGYLVLIRLRKIESTIDLDQFHGHSYKHQRLAFLFLMCCLVVSGFPISPTFIGEDLIFTHIHENQTFLALFVGLSTIIDGIAIIRMYARIFMGPHVKSIYEMAYRSS